MMVAWGNVKWPKTGDDVHSLYQQVDGAASKVKFAIGGKKPSSADLVPPREIVLKPAEVREEPMLIDFDPDPTHTTSGNTSNVELGSDPLTLLRPTEPSYSLMVQSGSGNLSSSSDSFGLQMVEGGVGGVSPHRPVGHCLSLTDHNTLRGFVQEFLFGKLVPHLDSVLRKMNEIVEWQLHVVLGGGERFYSRKGCGFT